MARTISERVAANVRAEMAAQQRTPAELSAHVAWPKSTGARRIKGLTDWTVDEVDAAAKFLGLPVVVLMAERRVTDRAAS